ncbi:hypothetical protein [uncultured Robinsoniella sp.]
MQMAGMNFQTRSRPTCVIIQKSILKRKLFFRMYVLIKRPLQIHSKH